MGEVRVFYTCFFKTPAAAWKACSLPAANRNATPELLLSRTLPWLVRCAPVMVLLVLLPLPSVHWIIS